MTVRDVLQVRLFGYGVPYRARFVDGDVVPLPTDAEREAADLAAALSRLVGADAQPAPDEDAWAVSVPFGRCGLHGAPREHLVVHGAAEAFVDVLSLEGPYEHGVEDGQMIAVEPQTVVRLRARPLSGQRVLVAFQTQDRTPLMGHAAPFTLDGQVPESYDERLRKTHAAFASIRGLWPEDPSAYGDELERFFGAMARRLEGDDAVARTSDAARAAGSYDATDEWAFFEYQNSMLDASVLQRILTRDPELFRFPGMFGGITTLFNSL